MLVHGIDWYVIPFTQEIGTINKIDRLVVHDVFGCEIEIDRADRQYANENRRWSMFTTNVEGEGNNFSEYFILSPSVGSIKRKSEIIEDIRFIRDENANLVWAIESSTENGLGNPILGDERYLEGKDPVNSNHPKRENTHLKYKIQSNIQDHWIPFPLKGLGILEKGALLNLADRPYKDNNGEVVMGRFVNLSNGRVLNPSDHQGFEYLINEEEVPRSGIQVKRYVYLCRWVDGSSFLWIGRTNNSGRGEGSSNLKFDFTTE